MAQIGTEKNPIRMSPRRTTKISGSYLKNENRNKYYDNYDRIFKTHETELDVARQKSKTFSMEQD